MKARIMLKAMELMNKLGVKFTMSDLARELGVSKRALYENFLSKEDLVSAITDAIHEDLRKQDREIMQRNDLDLKEKIKMMLVAYPQALGPINDRVVYDIQRYMPNQWKRTEHFLEEKWLNIFQLIQQGTATGLLRPANIAIIQRVFTKANSGLFDYQFLEQNRLSLKVALEAMAELLVYGLETSSGPIDN